MGNQQTSSQYGSLEDLPYVCDLRNALKLTPQKKKTSSTKSPKFYESLRTNSRELCRSTNPFCPMEISPGRKSGDYEWVTCCLISPVMAITSPRAICNEDSNCHRQSKICGMGKDNQIIEVSIKSVHQIQEHNVCLVVLEKPVLQLGWAGVTYLQSNSEINKETFRVIDHPKRQSNQSNSTFQYYQEIKRVTYEVSHGHFGRQKVSPGSIIFKLIDQRPYVVGIQINSFQARFFDKQILNKIQATAKQVMTQRKQREVLNQIDIQQLQLIQNI